MLPLLLALQLAAPQHDALRYDITLVPADTGTHLLGEVETTWRLATPDPVTVRLDSSLRVVRVLIDGRPNTRLSRTMYGRSEDDLVVPHQKPAADSIHTRIRYHGLARGGARVGTNRRGDRVFFATGSGDSARFWLPVPLRTEFDRTAAAFRVQTALGHSAIAAGSLEKVDTLPYGHAVWHYRMDGPAPIASLAVAAGPYRVHEVGMTSCSARCPVIEVWTYGSDRPATTMRNAGEMVEFYTARAGRYPYPRLAFVAAPVEAADGLAGAAPGVVFLPEGSFDGGGPPDSTVSLATARQWFGIAISPASPEDRWINGGLARYLASLWRNSAVRPADPGRGEAATGEAPPDGAALDGAVRDEVRGALALQRLREITGDSAFFAGLARYSAERMYQSASRADFVRAMSAAAGRDLDGDLRQAFDRAK